MTIFFSQANDKTGTGLCGCGIPEGCDNPIDIDNEMNSPTDINIDGSSITIMNIDEDNPLGPLTVNIDLPEDIIAESVQGIPESGVECTILNTRIADEDIDISCQVAQINEELELILGLCNNGNQEQSANATFEIISPDLEADIEDVIEIVINQLVSCQTVQEETAGDTSSGCSISSPGSRRDLAVYLFLLFPVFVMIRR